MIRKLIKTIIFFYIFFNVSQLFAYKGVGYESVNDIPKIKDKNSYALLIGISKYDHWDELPHIKEELDELEKALHENHGFKVERVGSVSCDELESKLKSFKNRYCLKKSSRVLIFYSGHGYSRDKHTKGYITAKDTPNPGKDGNEDGFLKKSISMGYLKAISKDMESNHTLFVFDSCFSGTVFSTRGPDIKPEYITNAVNKKVRQFITAGLANQRVPSKSNFTPEFIRGINGKADLAKDGYITGTELGIYLKKQMEYYNFPQIPMEGKLRDPDYDKGDFVFILNKDLKYENIKVKKTDQASLKIDVIPKDSEIIINSKKCTSPCSLNNLSPGKYIITMKKQGYNTKKIEKFLLAGRTWITSFELEKGKGSLRVNTNVGDSKVEIMNSKIIYMPGIELETGEYRLKISAPSYKTKFKTVNINTGDKIDIYLEFKRDKFTNLVGMEFVKIPPGTFKMGSPESEPERDDDENLHMVKLTRGFYMQTTEVTQGQYKAVMGENPSDFNECGDNCPVENVSWYMADEFIKKLNKVQDKYIYSLPTEAQWEYCARAGTRSPFAFGDCLSTEHANYDGNYPLKGCINGEYRKKIIPAGSLKANSWGLYDMHGNVREWCKDWHGKYPTGIVKDPAGAKSGSSRVIRGGSWIDNARGCRSADRGYFSPGDTYCNLGFRVVASQADR